MQVVSTPQNKTPANGKSQGRKSLAGTPATAGKKNTPKKQTPGSKKQPPATPKNVQNGNEANGTGGEKKRKQSQTPTIDESSPPKQQKLAKFAGTGGLDTPGKKKGKGERKLNKLKDSRAQARKQKRREKRTAIRMAIAALKEGRPVSPTLVNSLPASIHALESREDLPKAAQRQLSTYLKLQRLIEEHNPGMKKKEPVKQPVQKKQTLKKNVKKEVDVKEKAEDEENSDVDDATDEESEDADSPVAEKQNQGNNTTPKQNTRYVVFVGNLPYELNEDEVVEHFSQAGSVKSVRIARHPNSDKPKGFAHVEFSDKESYEKGLSLHHSFLKGRRINVEYSKPMVNTNDKVKKEVKSKNLKLHAMKKQGMLAGSVKQDQKRSVRRAKQSNVNGTP